MSESDEPQETEEPLKGDTRILVRMEKGDRSVQLDQSAELAWMVPAFLAGIGATLFALRIFLGMKQFEIPGFVAAVLCRTSSKIWSRRFKEELYRGEAPGCGPVAHLIGSVLFLPVSYWLMSGSFSLIPWLVAAGNVSSLLDALAELLFPYGPKPHHAPAEQRILLPLPEPVVPRDTATHDSESRSGFRFLIFAVIATLTVLVYLWWSQI